jgi:hypothetical protein
MKLNSYKIINFKMLKAYLILTFVFSILGIIVFYQDTFLRNTFIFSIGFSSSSFFTMRNRTEQIPVEERKKIFILITIISVVITIAYIYSLKYIYV